MTRRSRQPLCAGALALAALVHGALPAYGQSSTSSTPPPTQDATLRFALGLGNAAGCFPLLGLDPTDPNADIVEEIKRLGPQLGNELRAICGPSAVTSASALGGGLQSLQPAKTVTQFRLARSRIDQRRTRPAPRGPSREFNGGWVQVQQPLGPVADLGPRTGAGIFGAVEFAGRDRADTSYESGYESDVGGFSLGADYASGQVNVGGWFGRATQEGVFTRFSAIFSTTGGDTPESAAVLNDPDVLTEVCGGLSDGGSFDQTATQFGGFVAFGGSRGFVDAAYAWTRRDHEYARSVCAIETQGLVTFTGGVLRDDVHDPVDDIYAGVLSGVSTIDESSFSFRAGGDASNGVVSGGPRATFTVTRATTGAYVETGRNTVSTPITPVGDLPVVTRTPGGPIGLELAYDEQSRTSVLLEAGGEVAAHAGPVSPFFNGYWRHEFNDDYPVVTARMAQDLRPNPAVLSFGYDAYDANAFLIGFGANAAAGDRFVARVEITRLLSDALFSGWTFSAQARVRF